MSQTESGEDWDDKFENALLMKIGNGRPVIYREGYRNDLGNLSIGKLSGYWNKDVSIIEAKKRGIPVLDVRESDDIRSCAFSSPLLAQHPDRIDEYEGDVFSDDVGSLTRVTPRDFVVWWLAHGATEYHYDKLPEW